MYPPHPSFHPEPGTALECVEWRRERKDAGWGSRGVVCAACWFPAYAVNTALLSLTIFIVLDDPALSEARVGTAQSHAVH